jgi:hypothetical protein
MTYPARTALTVTIGGHDVTAYLNLGPELPGRLELHSVLTHQIDTCSFDVYNIGPVISWFKEWSEVIITDTGSGSRLFGGFLQLPSTASMAGGTRMDGKIQCSDYTCLLDHVKVKELFVGQTDAYMLAYVFNKYLPEINATTYVQALKTWPLLKLNNVTIRQAIDKLAQGAGCDWYVDYNKNLHFYYGVASAAPFDLSDTPNLTTTIPYTDFKMNLDGTGVINRVTVNGGTYLSDPQYHYIQGTGQDNIVFIPGGKWAAAPGNATLLVWRNDGTAGVPVWSPMNVLTPNTPLVNPADVIFDSSTSSLTQLYAWPNLPNAVRIYGCYTIPTLVRSFTDQVSFAYYGRYFDAVINDTNINDKQSALIAAVGLMVQNSLGGKQITCKIYQPGLRAGQTIKITNALHSIAGVSFQIQKADGVISMGGYAVYMLEIGVYHQNLIDMLIAVARNSQPVPDWADSQNLNDYLAETETITPISETTPAPTSTAGPYYWGTVAGGHSPLIWSASRWGGAATKSYILLTTGGKIVSADHGGDLILLSY